MYSGEGSRGHARLALLAAESLRCGIFLRRRGGLAAFCPASCGDFRDQAGQSADGVERQACIAADVPHLPYNRSDSEAVIAVIAYTLLLVTGMGGTGGFGGGGDSSGDGNGMLMMALVLAMASK